MHELERERDNSHKRGSNNMVIIQLAECIEKYAPNELVYRGYVKLFRSTSRNTYPWTFKTIKEGVEKKWGRRGGGVKYIAIVSLEKI